MRSMRVLKVGGRGRDGTKIRGGIVGDTWEGIRSLM
jgi:hypothetical protein